MSNSPLAAGETWLVGASEMKYLLKAVTLGRLAAQVCYAYLLYIFVSIIC